MMLRLIRRDIGTNQLERSSVRFAFYDEEDLFCDASQDANSRAHSSY